MKANSNLEWRHITVDDYNCILLDWWKAWGWPEPPTLDMLPEGYLISNDGVPIYAGFIFYTGTTIGWLEFVVSNRTASPAQRREGLGYLIEVISNIAKYKGVKVLFTSTNYSAFKNSLMKQGFEIGDTDVFQLTKKL